MFDLRVVGLLVLFYVGKLILEILQLDVFLSRSFLNLRVDFFLYGLNTSAGSFLLFSDASFKLGLLHLVEVLHLAQLLS